MSSALAVALAPSALAGVESGDLCEIAKLTASDADEGDLFGGSVSISGDIALVSARDDSEVDTFAGAAYVYERNLGGSDAWGERKKLLAFDASVGDRFGKAVSISGDLAVV